MNAQGRDLLVAGFGEGPGHGLSRYVRSGDEWSGMLVAEASHITALACHPRLPLVYGLSAGATGLLHVWDTEGVEAREVSLHATEGESPCSVAVDVDGNSIVVANYGSASLIVWHLDDNGRPVGEGHLQELTGHGVDRQRQSRSHPHQVVFDAGRVIVPDLGADLVRVLRFDAAGEQPFVSLGEQRMPPGAGPRHLVVLPDGLLAVSAELSSEVIIGRPSLAGPMEWNSVPSTRLQVDGVHRNYPGDIQRSREGDRVYVLNRGNDTLATFEISPRGTVLVAESSTGVQWPHHMAVLDDVVLVASRKDSTVVSMDLAEGIPGEPRVVFARPGATALLVAPLR